MQKWHTDSFVAFYKPDEELKLAFVTSKKIGNAVLRNKARRRLRALFYPMKTVSNLENISL